jgi:resuscitation-promoting factor RpfB
MLRTGRLLISLAALATLVLAGCAAGEDTAPGPDAAPSQAKTTPAKRDVVKHKLVRVRDRIGFSRETVKTSVLDKGDATVQQAGRAGVRVRLVRVTLKNGVEVGRDLVKTFVARQPVDQVRLVGTHVEPKPKPRPASSCDSNYAGACVPVASDVDCAGGSGDGPAYVDGPVRIVGSDVYDLDRDGDGVACDT